MNLLNLPSMRFVCFNWWIFLQRGSMQILLSSKSQVLSQFVTTFRCNSGMQGKQDVPKDRALSSRWLHLKIFWWSCLESFRDSNYQSLRSGRLETVCGSIIVAPINVICLLSYLFMFHHEKCHNSWQTAITNTIAPDLTCCGRRPSCAPYHH